MPDASKPPRLAAAVAPRHPIWARPGMAYPALFVGSVVESSVFPFPIEFPLTAVMLRGRAHVFPAAAAVIAGSIVGCVLAFAAGAAVIGALAPAVAGWADGAAMAGARARIADGGPWAVFAAMLTPVPVQITSFAAGLAGLAWGPFVLAVSAGRAVRYLAMAIVLFACGDAIRAWWMGLGRRGRWGVVLAAGLAFVLLVVAGLRTVT